MSKNIFLLFILLTSAGHILSQNPSTPLETLQKLKPGIYNNWKSFISNKPSITKAFTIITDYIVTEKNDSVISHYYYEFDDSSSIQNSSFGFFDGKKLYIRFDADKGIFDASRKQFFLPVDYIGRYSFISVDSKKPITILNFGLLALLDAGVSNKKETVFYFNKKGQLLQATSQAIGFLLRNDKDFVKEFQAEKKIDNAVFKKYLIKMNERYPL